MRATASAAGRRAAGEPTAVSGYVAFGLRWRSSIALPTYRKRLLNALGLRPYHYRTGLAPARGVPFVRVRRPELADRIEAHVRDLSL